ncbi:MAG: efflux RND transporter periplasmic adaptor subunit [Desulfobulbaceae bacterium]
MNTPRMTTLILIAVLAALMLAGGLYGARDAEEHAPADHALEEHHDQDHADHEEAAPSGEETHAEDDGHDHGTGVSDLDRPVEEMWADICEHDIPSYECDECRYEIGTVRLDAALLGEQGLVRTGYPEKRQGRLEERGMSGEVQLDETRTVHVASPLTGMIIRAFAFPGDKIEAGAPLFEVDSPEVAEAKVTYLKALAGFNLAVKAAEREALLFARKIAAQVEVQEAEARRAEAETEIAAARGRLLRLGLTTDEIERISTEKGTAALTGLVTVRAARAGTVIEGHVAPGEYAETGKELLTISDLDRVWVMADVKEDDLTAAANAFGGAARVEALGRTFNGRLDTITGRISEKTRTAKARFSVDNSDGQLRPGMFVSVRLQLSGTGETLAVPKVAVLADEGRTFVFTHKEGDYWVRRPVTLGGRFDGMVEILSGLTEGQKIITDGSFLLKSDVLRSKMGAGCAD